MKALAEAVLKGRGNQPPPVHAGPQIARLPGLKLSDLSTELSATTERMAEVSSLRRLSLIVLCLLPCLLAAVFSSIGLYVMGKRSSGDSSMEQLNVHLFRLKYLREEAPNGKRWQKMQLPALETYVAGTFGAAINDSNLWNNPYHAAMFKDERRKLAEELAAHKPTQAEMAAAKSNLKVYLDKTATQMRKTREEMVMRLPQTAMNSALIVFTATTIIPGLITALLFRGGVMLRVLGLAFVTVDGRPAARWRVFLRNAIMWAPIAAVVGITLYRRAGLLEMSIELSFGFLIYLACAILAVFRPSHGFQDRFTGTWLVPK